MSAKHISADKALKILKDASKEKNTKDDEAKIAFAMMFISQQPAADVEPVVRGEWRYESFSTPQDAFEYYECSVCTSRSKTRDNYCYYCGAHMERSGSGE